MAWGLQTYQDSSRREDLLDVLGDVSPDETPLLTLFGTSTAKGTLHEWLKYNVTRSTSVQADVEGADTTFSDLTQPSRANNITQIIKDGIRVSRTERRVNVAATGDPFAFQKAQGLRRLKMKMEYAILNAAKASGASGTARQMDGIDAWITTKLYWWSIYSKIALWLNSIIVRIAENLSNIDRELNTSLIDTVPGYVQE